MSSRICCVLFPSIEDTAVSQQGNLVLLQRKQTVENNLRWQITEKEQETVWIHQMDSHSEICSQLPVWAPEPCRMLNYMGLRECSHANRHREPIKITWLHFSPLPKGTAGSLTKLHTNLSLKHNWIGDRFPAVPTALRDMRFKFEDIASFFTAQENISKSRKETLLVYFPEKNWNNKNLSFRYFERWLCVSLFGFFLIWVLFLC